jgi:hypothetical protein
MRVDLKANPTRREFIVMSRHWHYNSGGKPINAYYLEDHENLEGKLDILENLGLVTDISFNRVRRYVYSEELVDYLLP